MDLTKIYERVAMWNANRYDRVLDKPLALSLLEEEYGEFLESNSDVEVIDALCDVIFVAYGVIWKEGLDENNVNRYSTEAMNYVNQVVELPTIPSAFYIATWLDMYTNSEQLPATMACFVIIYLALSQMLYEGLEFNQALEALTIVCDSNDSKSVEKTPAGIKANLNKGKDFIPPEPRLEALLKRVSENVIH